MAGKGGGAWKVAYADFVTAMMAFFLVMWIVAQNKPVKEAVARFFNDPYGTSNKPGRTSVFVPDPNGTNPPGGTINTKGPKGVPTADPSARLITDTDPSTDNGRRPTILALHSGRDAYVGTVIAFDEENAELSDRAKRRLNDLVPDLLGKPNKIEVRGHTSGRKLPKDSPFGDAWQLSYARSIATMHYLAQKGVEPRRFRLSQSAGFEPKSLGLGSETQAQNSRVEIYMLGELADELMGTRDERANQNKGSSINRPIRPKAKPQSEPPRDSTEGAGASKD